MSQKAVLIILVAMLILLGFAAFGNFSKEETEASQFQVDQLLIKVLIKEGESYANSIRVTNGGNAAEFAAEISGVSGMVQLSESRFSLSPEQAKVILIQISSDGNNSYKPGVYVGKLAVKSGGNEIDVPIIIEIETRAVLFDTNLNVLPQNRVVPPGSDNTIEVRLFNMKDREMNSVMFEYSLKDLNGNSIISESESVIVATQASFYKTLHIPENIRPGQYVFAVHTRYEKSSGTSSYLFDVSPAKGNGTMGAGAPSYYRGAAITGAAILAIIALVLVLAQPKNKRISEEYKREMNAYRQEALARQGEIGEMKRKLEEEYRKRLADELQKHGKKKADIAKKIRDTNAAISEQAKRMETKTKRSVFHKISKFMREAGGMQKNIMKGARQQEELRKEKEEERKETELEKERVRMRAEEERKKAEAEMGQERERIRKQKEEEKKRLDAQRLEQRKRESELRRKRMEALKRRLKHSSFKFLHDLGIVKTRKEVLEEERKRRLKAEQELRMAMEKKEEEKAERRRMQRRIKDLEMLERRKEREWNERSRQLELMEKRHRNYDQTREKSIRIEIGQQEMQAKVLGNQKNQDYVEEYNRGINKLKDSLKRMHAEDARRRDEEKRIVESLAENYRKQMKELEGKKVRIKPMMAEKEAGIRAKYESLQRHFAKADKIRRQEEKRNAKMLREREKKERERLERTGREKMESQRAELAEMEEEKRKELAHIQQKERMERERIEKERSIEAKREEKLRRLQRERYIRKVENAAGKIARKVKRGSFNVMHSVGLVRTKDEKMRTESIKERDMKERERLKREKMRERERMEKMIAEQKEKEKEILEAEKKKRAGMEADEKNRKERLEKLLWHRNELAKNKKYEARKQAEARIRAEKEAAKHSQAELAKMRETLARKKEEEYNAAKASLQKKTEELKKSRNAIEQKIKNSEKRLANALKRKKGEEIKQERALIAEFRENLAMQKALEQKHAGEEMLAKRKLSEQRSEILGLKINSFLLKLGIAGGKKKYAGKERREKTDARFGG